jgi:serine phosphatase RsbU (regulator of sigma subunit)
VLSTPHRSGRNDWVKAVDRFASSVAKAAGGTGNLWQRITDGMANHELWAEFTAEAQAGYKFYSRDVDWASFERMSKWQRRLYAGRALAWALLMKLAPSRRVFLLWLLAVVLIALIAGNSEFGLLLALAGLTLLLALELADRVTMKRDLEIARDIQHRLIPESPPVVEGVDIAFATRPANTVSGDYYDAFLRDAGPNGGAGKLLLVVADVAGKSIPAALLIATIQSSLRTLAAAQLPLPELVLGLNRYACANSLSGARFTTAFIAEYEPASRRLTYINAGHNAPLLRRGSGELERLEEGGIPLGVLTAAEYPQGEVTLQAGDLLVVFTDGVVEAENEREDAYGEPRLLEILGRTQPGTAAEALRAVLSSVDVFVGHTRQHDDITALVLLVKCPVSEVR